MIGSYIHLYESGELRRRADLLEQRLSRCDVCPRSCGVDRLSGEPGCCRSGYLPVVSAACDHHGEEPPISGGRGTGAIFFGNCNLRCVFCQNHRISQDPEAQRSRETTVQSLARQMVYLQTQLGCHNISLVSPSHFVPQIVRAVHEAVPLGLRVPLVYNSNGYDSVASLRSLQGVVDVYLPDLKYGTDQSGLELSGVADYVSRSRAALREMYRQVGSRLLLDDEGMACRGMIVRHLVLPGGRAGSHEVLTWLAHEFSRRLNVSLMAQYHPMHRARSMQGLDRAVSAGEYADVVNMAKGLGLENIWVQEVDSASHYLPYFDRDGHPFEVGAASAG